MKLKDVRIHTDSKQPNAQDHAAHAYITHTALYNQLHTCRSKMYVQTLIVHM